MGISSVSLTDAQTSSSTSSSPPLVYSLAATGSPSNAKNEEPSVSDVGGKGLSLIRCRTAGFPVPPGFCLTVAFFEPWLTKIKSTKEWKDFLSNHDDPSKEACDKLKSLCTTLSLDKRQQQELDAAIRMNLGNDSNKRLVAVRSSSPEEDLMRASFAGGYETTLGVSHDKLLEAIQTSFASALDFRVVQYKLQNALDITLPRVAVVIQEQLDSDVSGVGFSLNPQNNCYDEAVISCNFGLGETVVAGVVVPDTFVVDKVSNEIVSKTISEKSHAVVLEPKGGTRESLNADPTVSSLTDEKVLEVTSLIARVEEYYMDKPIDIEWAFQNDKLYLLQARPITVYLPLFPEMITTPGAPKNLYIDFLVMTQGFSDPMSILGLDIWARVLQIMQPFMPHGKDGILWELHGRGYFHVSNMLATPGGAQGIVQAFSLHDGNTGRALQTIDLSEYTPDKVTDKNKSMMWNRIKYLFQSLPSLFHGMWCGENAMDWYIVKVDTIMERFQQGGIEEQGRNGELSFSDHVQNVQDAFEDLMSVYSCLVVAFYSTWRLEKMFHGNKEMQDLLVALNMDLDGNPTSEMGYAMLHLASFPEIQETPSSKEFLKRLERKSYSDDVVDAYNEFMLKYGCRGMKEIDAATPRTYEDPAGLFDRIKLIDVENNQILSVKQRKVEAYQTLLEHATQLGKERKFKHHASIIQKVAGYREHGKYMWVFLVAYLRRRALELGNKWAHESRLDKPVDIFNLHIDDIAMGEQVADFNLMEVALKNKEAYNSVASITDWPTLSDSRGKILRAPRENIAGDGDLVGDPISPGAVRGRAKVLKDPYEKPVEKGEILVTKATEPSWTPIFINAAGVVLEVGGPLQHGAIIAREYGIPCVSGVEKALSRIKDGDLLVVDGTNGVVNILDADNNSGKD